MQESSHQGEHIVGYVVYIFPRPQYFEHTALLMFTHVSSVPWREFHRLRIYM